MFPLRALAAAVALACLGGTGAAQAQQGVLVDRVVAVVSGTIITMTDARAAIDFGFVDVEGADDPISVAIAWLVDRQLMLEEADRYGTAPPEPDRVAEAVAAIRGRAGDPETFATRLAALGLSEADLRLLVRRNLQVRSYVDRRFDATLAVTESDAQEYYRLRVDQFVRGGRPLSFEEVRTTVYEAIARERRDRAVADWVAGLRRRSDVHVLYVPRR